MLAGHAVEAGVISAEEARTLVAHHGLVARVIAVDDFDRDLAASLLLPAIEALRQQSAPMRQRVAA